MTRRARAGAFALGALACAAIAAAIANGYRDSVSAQYGALRPVLVAVRDIPAGQMLGEKEVRESTAVRRIPASFVPQGALARPAEALGQTPAAPLPTGAYVLAAQLTVPQPDAGPGPAVGEGRRPVQISVSGADALSIAGSPEGSLVDVVVSEQPNGSGNSKTYVAAPGVRLLALGGSGPEGNAPATLALTESQALELIGAEGSAREIRLLPRG
jgi:Flp pilus assembly protein CpaB